MSGGGIWGDGAECREIITYMLSEEEQQDAAAAEEWTVSCD
jgi:hypothetical protein